MMNYKEIIKKEIKKLEKRREYLKKKEEYYYQFRKITREEINFEIESIEKRLKVLYQFLENGKITRYIKAVLIFYLERELIKIDDKLFRNISNELLISKEKLLKQKEELLKKIEEIKNISI